MDFAALVRYPGPTARVRRGLARIQVCHDPDLAAVSDMWQREGFSFAESPRRRASWRPCGHSNWKLRLRQAPKLPNLEAYLDLPSDFAITFGRDAVEVYHWLRWHFFLTQRHWQRVMLAAVRRIRHLLGGSDCFIANDEHPLILSFREGKPFDECVEAAHSAGERQVRTIGQMFVDKGIADELYYEGRNGKRVGIPIWDTRGYWRLPAARHVKRHRRHGGRRSAPRQQGRALFQDATEVARSESANGVVQVQSTPIAAL
jgi:hypothetical protein